ncbi:hypothetical protein TD95_001447 [Thielaviopsis punctulata]|uniref:tRNA(Phe) 7-[(3-amino-3-carboxypropyl)-4-demethylwyosine(37)-N(4)]-methyltransferase n=1 Tax=Thielaviopsis punctulata TaxID=72032 RepID=A0A0F4ZBR6_9PEZI|nr:hypothetical protein TD95_001447 [Thielaviopsis punctulata]
MASLTLPSAPASFLAKKASILQGLAVPDAEYTDLSPKGSVDLGIRALIAEINAIDGLVTTSSCAGRVSVFVEGRKKGESAIAAVPEEKAERGATLAAVGGKGGGGAWLFVSHDPVEKEGREWRTVLGLQGPEGASCTPATGDERLVHFKFEPMILHILTASPAHAQLALRCALQAGFRESGAVNITAAHGAPTPMVAVRSMGLGFEALLGHRANEQTTLYVPDAYLDVVMALANERFVENARRIGRFREAFVQAFGDGAGRRKGAKEGGDWEDAEVRRARKREEGLARRDEVLKAKAEKRAAKAAEEAKKAAQEEKMAEKQRATEEAQVKA